MSHLSPGFSARFASIELDSPTTSAPTKTTTSRKQYPASLYPHNHSHATYTTPSKGPRLSTAVRAEIRSCSDQKLHTALSGSHKRNLHSVQGKDDRNIDENRHEDKHTRLNHTQTASFMKETSSSRKKQSSAAVHDRTLPQTRSVSHSEIHTRRNHHYAVLVSKKRQNSKSTKSSELGVESASAADVPFADKPTIFTSYSPSKTDSAGHTPQSQEDVYTRLYQSSQKSRSRPEKPNSSNNGSQEKRVLKRTPSAAKSASPHSREKPATISEMYRMIYKADPEFFTESNALDPELTAQEPIPASDLINRQHLTVYERGELMRNSSVYYVPQKWKEYTPDINVSSFKNNYGFDDKEGNYIVRSSDHIEYRYEIVRVLGTGSFGNVIHCKDHMYSARGQRRNVAIKLIKNELDWSLQAVSEIKMLKHLMAASRGKVNRYIMNYCDHFHFRGHMCIVSEMLSLNLYTFLELGHFRGVSLSLVKDFAYKILKGLQFVHDQKVIHCDIKPENIMIRLPPDYNLGDSDVSGFDVKLIDFGSSCFESETSFSYIQSRFYRAPEVILGSKYSHEIDIWSFGCVLAELFTGSPLLPGKNELEQIALILEMFGAPPSSFVLAERKRLVRFMKMDTHRKLNDPLVSDPSVFANKPSIQVDEKKLKKTLLYKLFSLDGKINLQFLNMQLQAMEPKNYSQMPTSSPFKRNVKISARSLDVSLRLHGSDEDKTDQTNFSRFIGSIFQWIPSERPKATDLLTSPFLKEFA